MNRASSATLVFDPMLVALADVSDRPGMPSASVGKLHPAAAAPRPVRKKARIVAPAPKSVPAPVEIIAAPQPAKPRAAIIVGQQQKRLAAEKGGDGRPMRPYAIRPGFTTAAPAKACQWIEGAPSPDDSCKCLAPSAPGASYCPSHAQRAYRVLPRGVAAAFPLISPTP